MRSATAAQVARSAPGSTAISSSPPYRAGRSISRTRSRRTLGHQPKHLVADAVAEIVVELLEMIDVDQEHAERLALFHRRDLGVAEELIERTAVRQTGERVGLGALLGLVQGIADRVELSRLLGEAAPPAWRRASPPWPARSSDSSTSDLRIDARPRSGRRHRRSPCICERLSAMAAFRYCLAEAITEWSCCETLLTSASSAACDSDIGREQVAIGGGVELSLVADQDVDGALEIGRGAERIFEPDVKIVRRRRDAMLRHRAHGFFRDGRGVLEIKLVERVGGHDLKRSRVCCCFLPT